MAAWECSSIASGCGQPFSTASRKPMQRADAGIAAPGEHELVDAAHADELVVDQVRRHADQRQALALLADHLVAGGEGE